MVGPSSVEYLLVAEVINGMTLVNMWSQQFSYARMWFQAEMV